MPVTIASYLKHKGGLFVVVRGWTLGLGARSEAAPIFTPENTGKLRVDDWHKATLASARKKWPAQLTLVPLPKKLNPPLLEPVVPVIQRFRLGTAHKA